jgi:hypothetical protein
MSAIVDTIDQFENIENIASHSLLNGQEIEHFLEKSISKTEDLTNLKKEAKKRYSINTNISTKINR